MLNQLISKIEVMVLTDYLVYAFVRQHNKIKYTDTVGFSNNKSCSVSPLSEPRGGCALN